MKHPFLVLMAATVVVARAANENKAVFQDMCRILRLTLAPPEIPKLPGNINVKEKAKKVLETIRSLNFSSADAPLYDYIMKADRLGETKNAEDSTKGLSAADWEFLQAHFNEMKGTGPNSLTQRFPRTVSEAARKKAHRQIGLALSKAAKLYEKFSSEELNLEGAVIQARKDLVAAAYGETVGRDVVDTGATKGTNGDPKALVATENSFYVNNPSSHGCHGGTGGNNHPGLSLAADILCLCDLASGGLSTTGGACGLTGVGTLRTQWTDVGSGKNAWNVIAPKCTVPIDGAETAPDPTPENLAAALARFYGLLGTGGENIDQSSFAAATIHGKHNILGFFVTHQSTKAVCDGNAGTSGASHGVCVNYNDIIESGKDIGWVKNIKKAMVQLQKVRETFAHQKDILTKMEMLEQLALQIHEDSLEGAEPSSNGIKLNQPEKGMSTSQDSQTVTVASQKEASASHQTHVGKHEKIVSMAVVLLL